MFRMSKTVSTLNHEGTPAALSLTSYLLRPQNFSVIWRNYSRASLTGRIVQHLSPLSVNRKQWKRRA